jgi:hypothetical protein
MRRDPEIAANRLTLFARSARTTLLLAMVACSNEHTAPAPASATDNARTLAAKAAMAAATEAPTAIPHGLRKELNLDIPVFVDGKEVSVLRFGELPPGVPVTTNPVDREPTLRYYRLADYLKAIGVNLDRVQAVHFAGKTNQITSLEGSEIRADKDRFVFDFLDTNGGIAKPMWRVKGLKNQLHIDGFYGINVFVATKPWEIDPARRCYVEDDDCKPVARFTSGDLMKGTRVYADGKLVGYVKRRLLSDDALVSKSANGDASYSLDKYLASLGIDREHAKEIRLLSGDDLIVSATGSQWEAAADKLTFYLVKHGHGKVRANVPADLQLKAEGTRDRDVRVTSIQVFSHKEPRSLPLVSIDDVFDPGPNVGAMESALAAQEGSGKGSGGGE